MTFERAWSRTVLAGALSSAVWVVAAINGYALETIWLPAVAVAAAWPRHAQARACLPRLRSTSAKEPP
jgi:hypothetical protein